MPKPYRRRGFRFLDMMQFEDSGLCFNLDVSDEDVVEDKNVVEDKDVVEDEDVNDEDVHPAVKFDDMDCHDDIDSDVSDDDESIDSVLSGPRPIASAVPGANKGGAKYANKYLIPRKRKSLWTKKVKRGKLNEKKLAARKRKAVATKKWGNKTGWGSGYTTSMLLPFGERKRGVKDGKMSTTRQRKSAAANDEAGTNKPCPNEKNETK